jgi:hypothetical protein
MAEAGIDQLRAKGQRLTDLAIALADVWLVEHGFTVGSPGDAETRGSHVSLRHPDGCRVVRAMIDLVDVLPTSGHPAGSRLGMAPAPHPLRRCVGRPGSAACARRKRQAPYPRHGGAAGHLIRGADAEVCAVRDRWPVLRAGSGPSVAVRAIAIYQHISGMICLSLLGEWRGSGPMLDLTSVIHGALLPDESPMPVSS